MADQAKKHHVVSKFYLRYFADEANQVTTVMLPGDRQFLQSVGRATVRTRFYTAVGHGGQPTDAAETAFGGIETVAAEAWRELSEGVWPLTPEAREHVAGWIALQLLRGNGNRASMSQRGGCALGWLRCVESVAVKRSSESAAIQARPHHVKRLV